MRVAVGCADSARQRCWVEDGVFTGRGLSAVRATCGFGAGFACVPVFSRITLELHPLLRVVQARLPPSGVFSRITLELHPLLRAN